MHLLATNLSDGKIVFLVVFFIALGLIIGGSWPRPKPGRPGKKR